MNKMKLVIVVYFCSIFFPPSLYADDFSWELFIPAIIGKGAKPAACDQSHLYLCKDELSCINAKGYWYNNTCNIIPPPNPGSLQFKMSGLVGLVKSNSFAAKSSINKIDPTSKITDTTTSVMGIDITGNLVEIANENLPVKEFLISPTGEVYIVLEYLYSYIDQNGNEQQSILLKVNPENNTYTDIDNTLSSINTNQQGSYSSKSVQFDAAGNIYYAGYSDSKQVLRRSDGTTHTDLINDNVYIFHWLVIEDGTVFIFGATTSTDVRWFRKIRPDNSLANIIGSSADIYFIERFPDNKVYFGEMGKIFGIGKILPTDDFLSEKCLIGNSPSYEACGTGGSLGNEYEVVPTCTANGLVLDNGQCSLYGNNGTAVTDIQSTDSSVLALVGLGAKQIWRYYPNVEYIDFTMVEDVRLFKTDGSSLIIHGLNALTQNKLVKYDLISSAETDLLPSDDIEIYHINIKSDGKIWFDGLRFSNNTYVIGYVNTSNSNEVVFIQDTTVKLEDFQTF